VDLSTERKIKQGLPESEARRAALVELGGVEQVKELVRDAQLGHFLEALPLTICDSGLLSCRRSR